MMCEVERFERGTDLTTKDRINKIQTYFMIGQLTPEEFVGLMMIKIVPSYLSEIKQYQSVDYFEFRES